MGDDCKKCKKKVLPNDKAVMCCLCSRWIHTSCSKISDDNYASINSLGSLVMWFCESDRRKIKSLVIAEGNSREDAVFEELKVVTSKLDDISKKLEDTTKLDQISKKLEDKQPSVSYASVLIGSTNQSTTNLGMVIKPKVDGANCKDTEKAVRDSIDLVKINAGVTKIRHVQNGGVYLGARTGNELQKLKDEATNAMGHNFEIYIPKLRLPKVVIRGVGREYANDEFVNELMQTNPGFDENDHVKVVYHRQVKQHNGTKWMYFLEVSGRTYSKIVDRHVNIDFQSQVVREYVDVLRCYKCQQYGHKSTNCNAEEICGKCSGNHKFSCCNEANLQCMNCKAYNTQYQTNLSVDHVCGSRSCHQQIEMMKKQKERINYNEESNHV